MRILVTGNQGYIGTNLTHHLVEKGHEVFGLDCGYFSECNLTSLSNEVPTLKRDIRDVEVANFVGFDLVVHLAALSNDPVGATIFWFHYIHLNCLRQGLMVWLRCFLVGVHF